MNNLKMIAGALALSGLAVACGDGGTTGAPQNVQEIGGSQYYVVTRVDTRRCASPMCGGYFVKAVNQETTVCPDGTEAEECLVNDVDYTSELAESLGDDALVALDGRLDNEGREELVVRGRYSVSGENGYVPGFVWLVVDEAHQLAAGDVSAEPLYLARNTGVVCVTTPCPSTELTLLNADTSHIQDFDLGSLDLTQAEGEQLFAQMYDSGAIIGGSEEIVDDIIGDVLLRADAVYLHAGTAEPEPHPECGLPTGSCMNGDNYAQCIEVAEQCPGEVMVLESCPLQFQCPTQESP